MKIDFTFKTRQGMAVAMSCAEEIENNTAYGREFGLRRDREVRPVLMSVKGDTFRFEGGTVVKLELVEMSQFDECWRDNPEEWVVCSATVRYYERDSSCSRISDQKTVETWNHKKLANLKDARPWWHPHVMNVADIKGTVCVFWDNASADGYISVNPDYNQDGHYTSSHEVTYSRFVEGDLDRAKAEAKAKLDEWLAE